MTPMKTNTIRMLLAACLLSTAAAAGVFASEQGPVIREVTDDQLLAGGVFNVATYAAPRAVTLAETGLKEAGLQAGPVIPKSDEIRIFTSRDVMNAAPLARIWLNAREGGQYWFITGGEGDASTFTIPEGAAVVIWIKSGSTPLAWKNVFR